MAVVSPAFGHAARSASLLLLSSVLLPLNSFILFISYVLQFVNPPEPLQRRRDIRSSPGFKPEIILVTGVGMSKGLALARLFYAEGHDVVGADFEHFLLPAICGRVSKSLKAFYRLSRPDEQPSEESAYAQSILDIVKKEKVRLWVSCSGVASAVEDGIAKELVESVTDCKAVQHDIATTKKLHEKHTFIEYTKSISLHVPETQTVTSRAAALGFLETTAPSGIRFILKYIGTDDTVRGDMTILPLATTAATKKHLSRLAISEDRPWILQQFIQGPEFCTHALVVRGEVKGFVACPSKELLMHYESLSPESALSRSMLQFTQKFAAAMGADLTGHVSFDFLVDADEARAAGEDLLRQVNLHPIECNPRAHTAVCLFNDTPEIVSCYLDLLRPHQVETHKHGTSIVYPRLPTRRYYWAGHDLVELVILPLWSFASSYGKNVRETSESLLTFVQHLLFWHDGTFERWDPLPAWWLYHVYWPLQFATALFTGERWSRVNVSTCKMFKC